MKKIKRCIAIILARGGSKRIKNKNIKLFFKKPIISHPIKKALLSNCFDEVYVSTDSKKIAKISSELGAKVPYLRPKNLSNDNANTIDAVNHFIRHLTNKKIEFDYVCCLYPTAIFFKTKHLKEAFKDIKKPNNNFIFTVTEFNQPIERSFSIKNNKISISMEKKFFNSRSNNLQKKYYDAGQFYFGKRNSFLKKIPVFKKNTKIIKLDKNFTVDINEMSDWKLAELIYKNSYFL